MSLSARQRKVAGWAILTVLVLGSAYWSTRPGSDTPAANGKASAREYAPIERFVQEEMKVQRVPGLALGIVRDDRIAYVSVGWIETAPKDSSSVFTMEASLRF